MEKNKTLWFGVGGCGNTLLQEITNKTDLISDPKTQTFFMNFAKPDLSSKIKGKTFLLDYGGTGRDPKTGQKIVEENDIDIDNFFENAVKDKSIERVVLITSLGGGTGVSLVQPALEVFLKKKKVCLVAVLPSNKEGISTLPNAVKAYQFLYNNYVLTHRLRSFLIIDNDKFIKDESLSMADYKGINERIVYYINNFFDETHCYQEASGYSVLDLNERRRVQNWGHGITDYFEVSFDGKENLDDFKYISSIFSGRYKLNTAKAISIQILFKNMEANVKSEHIEFAKDIVIRIKKRFYNAFFVFGFNFQNSKVKASVQARIIVNGLEVPRLLLSNAKRAARAIEKIKKEHEVFDVSDLDLEI